VRAALLALVLASCAWAQPAVEGVDPASPAGIAFAEGWEAYTGFAVADAIPRWREAVDRAQTDAAVHALRARLAEALRRAGQSDEDAAEMAEAVTLARSVVAEDDCHAHAHLVLADALDPQGSSWDGASLDEARAHLARAVECDPDDGNAWTAAWGDAVRQGDAGAEGLALDALARVGFWPEPALAFARWTLQHVPAGAVVLTGGDSDTIPMRIVQRVEGLRPDMAVVDAGLLEMPEVARRVSEAEGLPLPDSVETFAPRRDGRGSTETPDGRLYTLRDAVVDRWREASASGTLGRPLVAALTLEPAILATKTDLLDRGPYLVPASSAGFDAEAARAAFAELEGRAFVGDLVSDDDRSPIRHAFPFDPGGIVLFQILQTAVTLAQDGDAEGAEAVYARARQFAADAGKADDPLIAVARDWIDAAGPPP